MDKLRRNLIILRPIMTKNMIILGSSQALVLQDKIQQNNF